jgi:hypothetical protein
VNDSGQIVGIADPSSGASTGFLNTSGSFTDINFPNVVANATIPSAINDAGQIVALSSKGATYGAFWTPLALSPESSIPWVHRKPGRTESTPSGKSLAIIMIRTAPTAFWPSQYQNLGHRLCFSG